jgi:hypothetical protein
MTDVVTWDNKENIFNLLLRMNALVIEGFLLLFNKTLIHKQSTRRNIIKIKTVFSSQTTPVDGTS